MHIPVVEKFTFNIRIWYYGICMKYFWKKSTVLILQLINLTVFIITSVQSLSRVWLVMDTSPTPRAYSNSCPSSRWCHPTISSSVVPFSSCLQYFQASESFPMSQFFTLGGQSIGVSASASVFPMNIQDWFPLQLTDLISLKSKGLSRVFSNTAVQKYQFFGAQFSL